MLVFASRRTCHTAAGEDAANMMRPDFGPVVQIAYVVEDFKAAVGHWVGRLGVGPFTLFPTPIAFDRLVIAGRETRAHDIIGRCGLAYSGDLLIELIEPGPDPSPYADFLRGGRRGVHHLGFAATDFDAQMATARADGVAVAMEGALPLSRFAYLATDAEHAGTMAELIEIGPGLADIFDRVRQSARGWDGRDPVRTLDHAQGDR